VTKRLTEREEMNRGFIRRMLEIGNMVIHGIKSEMKAIVRQFLAGDLKQEHQ